MAKAPEYDPKANIFKRIHNVMKEIEYIRKDTEVNNQYMAVSHDNVSALTRPLFIKHGIVVQPTQISGGFVLEKDGKLNKQHIYQGAYDISFVNIDDPRDVTVVGMQGQAADSSDKGPGKAASYATKTAILKQLLLETGVNDEGRYHEDTQFTDEQKEIFDSMINEETQDPNPLAYMTFVKSLSKPAYDGLFNSFEDGDKVKGKGRANLQMARANTALDEYAFQLEEAEGADAKETAWELISDLTEVEKGFLMPRIKEKPGIVAFLTKVSKEFAGGD